METGSWGLKAMSIEKATEFLLKLRTVDEMKSQAREIRVPDRRSRSNSHVHLPPNFSAFENVKQAISMAAKQNVHVLGASNYYDYTVYADFAAQAQAAGIFPLFGLEIICMLDEMREDGVKINDPGNPGKFYICGKGITRFDDMTLSAMDLLGLIRALDSLRMTKMIARLGEIFTERGLELKLAETDIIDMIVRRSGCSEDTVYVQERHVAQAYQEAMFDKVPLADRIVVLNKVLGGQSKAAPDDSVAVQNEIRSHLLKAGKPAFIEEKFVTFDQAFKLILELGGIPCYPTLADGARPICEYEVPVEKLIESIRESNIHAAEFIPVRNEPKMLIDYINSMRAAGLVVTAGTEHNTLDMLPIEPTCVDGKPIPDKIKDVFWEGACVVAAHQFLTLNGECGFVDDIGRPNPDYRTAEERIGAFRKIGAAVMQRYFEINPPR